MSWVQFRLVLWKNYIIRKRHWILTLLEGFIPIVLFMFIAYGRAQITGFNKTEVPKPTYANERSSDQILQNIIIGETKILYTPVTEFTENLIHKTRSKLSNFLYEDVIGFPSEGELIKYFTEHRNDTVIAVLFGSGTEKRLNYNIKIFVQDTFEQGTSWETNKLFYNKFVYAPESGSELYIQKGFLAVQYALETSFIETLTQNDIPYTFQFQEFPYPPYKIDTFVSDMFMHFLPLITLFSFIFICPAVLKRVVEEKQSGIKELLKMVGMKKWMLWLGWYIHSTVANIISITCIVFLMKVPLFGSSYPPIEFCNFSVLFVFLFLYCTASIAFCFIISSCFNKPSIAMVFGIVIWILSYFIPSNIVSNYDNMRWIWKVLLSLLPNMALHFGYSEISVYEMRGIGSHWNNINTAAGGGNNDISLGCIFIMLIIQTFVYILLTFYIENISPGPYGVPKKWNYPLTNLVKYVRRKLHKDSSIDHGDGENNVNLNRVEKGQGLSSGISINNLHKTYKNNKYTVHAVNGLNLDIYKNQITILLGHNGAGKTTTMSMITGMIAATSGNIRVNGYDVNKNMDEIRKSLGLCPQHNLLFSDLNVIEHLVFFARLKGCTPEEAKKQANELMKTLNIFDKRYELACTLSGGMKRKLCLGMAIIGHSEVLILDEPTSGMDPESRRELWNLLLEWRGSRTILITTHFMEEADVLGDWIAIMAKGNLVCYGTPIYLKKNYNTGYHLSVMVNSLDHKDLITNLVQTAIPNSNLKYENGNNLVYLLPIEYKYKFGQLLKSLEKHSVKNNAEEGNIITMTITITTLEEVFLRTSKDSLEYDEHELTTDVCTENTKLFQSAPEEKNWINHVHALLKKRLMFSQRMWKYYVIPVIISVLIVGLALYLGSNASDYDTTSEPKLDLKLSVYGKTTTVIDGLHNKKYDGVRKYYKDIIQQQNGNILEVESTLDGIVQKGVENIAFYKNHMIIAANFHENLINILYSNNAIHGAPISLNTMMNAVLKSLTGGNSSITASVEPFNPTDLQRFSQEKSEVQIAILWLVLVPIALLFIMGTFIILPNREHATKFSGLQFITGVYVSVYWFSNIIFDMLLYLIPVGLLLIIILLNDVFRGAMEAITFVTILVVYGLAAIPFSYLFSFKKSLSGGFALLVMSGMFIGVTLTVAVCVLEESRDEYYEHVGKILKYCFLATLPQFGLTYMLLKFSRKAVHNYNWNVMPYQKRLLKCDMENPCCNNINASKCESYQNYFTTSDPLGIGADIFVMFVPFFLYMGLVIFFDSVVCKKVKSYVVTKFYELLPFQKDVQETRLPGKNHKTQNYLFVEGVQKRFKDKLVVKNVSFAVERGQSFGLLGVNGAGKTTTFRMLTKDIISNNGRIGIKDGDNVYTIDQEDNNYMEKIGYCPQFDALNYDLSGREILVTMARLRNFDESTSHSLADEFLQQFGLKDYADQPCGSYSGGNKRKLALAIALLGCKDYILMDEPTNGVDPSGRRKIWSILKSLQKYKRSSYILTSHSMDECEALCERMAIMKEGNVYVDGTIPELKAKYGKGSTLKIKIKLKTVAEPEIDEVDSVVVVPKRSSTLDSRSLKRKEKSYDTRSIKSLDSLKKDIQDNFPQSDLKDSHEGLLHYHMNEDNSLSELFNKSEELKDKYADIVEDYAISGSSLEEVFLNVAQA